MKANSIYSYVERWGETGVGGLSGERNGCNRGLRKKIWEETTLKFI